MKNEIKINKANKSLTFINNGIAFSQFGIADEILDLITNLQQENKEWGMIFDTFSSRPYAHRYLEEKRKELGNKRIIGLDSEMIYKDYYDYKSRCEKAVEYNNQIIKDTKDFYRPTTDIIYSGDALIEIATNNINILQNGSDEK